MLWVTLVYPFSHKRSGSLIAHTQYYRPQMYRPRCYAKSLMCTLYLRRVVMADEGCIWAVEADLDLVNLPVFSPFRVAWEVTKHWIEPPLEQAQRKVLKVLALDTHTHTHTHKWNRCMYKCYKPWKCPLLYTTMVQSWQLNRHRMSYQWSPIRGLSHTGCLCL